MSKRPTLDQRRYNYINNLHQKGIEYKLTDYTLFDFSCLSDIVTLRRKAVWDKRKINDVIIMADTETSKQEPTRYEILKDGTHKAIIQPNHIVCWTITLRAYGFNIVTLRGRKPSEFADCIAKIHDALPGDVTYIFMHNLAYDWVFLERFLFKKFGFPESQLNTRPHYPIQIEFKGGIIFRDSLILLQRGLEKAAADLDVQHQKCVGSWDYEKIRNQNTELSETEWMYAEFDTLSGSECIEAYSRGLNKGLQSLPLTATGIPRGDLRDISKAYRWKEVYDNLVLTFEQYCIVSEHVYHGGFTHGNRHFINTLIRELVRCYDFASSYPYTMLAYKFPMSAFTPIANVTPEHILKNMDEYAFFFKLIMVKPQIKEAGMPMPYLQLAKCTSTVNAVLDNGRIINAEYAEIWCTEYDLAIIAEQYKFAKVFVTNVNVSVKKYLPRWFTDYVYEQFEKKTRLKHVDKVLYQLAKGRVNSCYGMTVQRVLREDFKENYETGDFDQEPLADPEKDYENEIKKTTSFLPYQWGCWVTAIATFNLFKLGACAGTWYYSDTDSCYGSDWDEEKIRAYNDRCKKRLKANGYGPVIHEGREYWLGVAESHPTEDAYTEFKYMGAKRYAGRCVDDGEIHITVAGVPKKEGAKCLNSLDDFVPGFVFDGERTGKKTHTYLYEDIYTDAQGNECGNSIDLTMCDYKLDSVDIYDWEDLLNDEYTIIDYEA